MSILLAEELANPLHHAVLLWVVWVVFAWDLQQARERLIVLVNLASDLVCDLATWIYQHMPMCLLRFCPVAEASTLEARLCCSHVLPSQTHSTVPEHLKVQV